MTNWYIKQPCYPFYFLKIIWCNEHHAQSQTMKWSIIAFKKTSYELGLSRREYSNVWRAYASLRRVGSFPRMQSCDKRRLMWWTAHNDSLLLYSITLAIYIRFRWMHFLKPQCLKLHRMDWNFMMIQIWNGWACEFLSCVHARHNNSLIVRVMRFHVNHVLLQNLDMTLEL